MSVDTQKIIEIVKQVKPLFLDREGWIVNTFSDKFF